MKERKWLPRIQPEWRGEYRLVWLGKVLVAFIHPTRFFGRWRWLWLFDCGLHRASGLKYYRLTILGMHWMKVIDPSTKAK